MSKKESKKSEKKSEKKPEKKNDQPNIQCQYKRESENGRTNLLESLLFIFLKLTQNVTVVLGSETGIEMHNGLDQFIRVESGSGKVEMGRLRSNMNYTVPLDSRYAVLIPEGTYHNIINTGKVPLKLYSIYTPKAHPFGTVDTTREDAERREADKK